MFETEPASVLCVRNNNKPEFSVCATTKTYQMCGPTISGADNSTTYEFFCNSECSQSDVNFWYRFRVCPYPAYDDNEEWCRSAQPDFPSTLVQIPDGVIFTTTTQGVSSAQRMALSYLILIVLSMCWGTW